MCAFGRSSVAAVLDARQSLDEPHHESVSSSITGVFPSINVTYGSNNEASRDFDTPLEIERSPQACSGHVCSRAAPSRAHTSGARLHSTDYHPPFLISECTWSWYTAVHQSHKDKIAHRSVPTVHSIHGHNHRNSMVSHRHRDSRVPSMPN